MRVLLIAPKSEKLNGGIAVWTANYLDRCSDLGIACDVVNTEVIGKRAKKDTSGRNYLDEFIRTKRIFTALSRVLKNSTKPEVAHLNTSCSKFGLFRDYLIARRIQKKGIPVITHYHCDIPNYIHSSLSRRCLSKLVSISKKNLVLCENSRRYLADHFGIEAIKVPNFIDEEVIIKKEKTINPTMQKIFFVGRVEEAKGVAEIYELAKRFPNISIELAGGINDTVAQWDKPENLILLGGMPHEQVIEHMDEADLFLFPSHSEGFSVALVESMARGVPAIATDVGAAADMLGDGCGIVVEKGNVNAMEQAIRKLESSDIRERISRAAVAKVSNSYTICAVMERFKQIYQSVL